MGHSKPTLQEDAETVEGVGVNGVPSCDVDEVDGVEYVTDDDQGVRKFYVQLLCAKRRVTPLLGLTIPHAELCGVVLASRRVDETFCCDTSE